jgi:hypothetical protein
MYVKVQTVDSVHHNVGMNSHYHMSFKVLTEVLLKIQVFWDVMVCQMGKAVSVSKDCNTIR